MPAFTDLNLTHQEFESIDRASRWIRLSDTSADYLLQFITSSLSDPYLVLKVSALTPEQMQLLLDSLRAKRELQ